MANQCKLCKTPLDGNGSYCTRCYSKIHVYCPACMVLGRDGRVRVRVHGKQRAHVDCNVCNNERFLIDEDRYYQLHPTKGD